MCDTPFETRSNCRQVNFAQWRNSYLASASHGRRNGFERGTADGVEHEPKNRDTEGGEGVWTEVFPLPTKGSGGVPPGKFIEIHVQIGAFWSANH